MLAMREDEIPVDITCNLESLRFMHHTFSKAYQNWAGGDPEEQVKLRACRDAFTSSCWKPCSRMKCFSRRRLLRE